MAKRTDILVEENSYFAMYEIKVPGKTAYRIYKKGACALEEVKTLRGGGHATAMSANDEFIRMTCVAVYNNERHLFPA